MTKLEYTLAPGMPAQRLNLFLRTQGLTAGLIKAVKYDGGGFFCDGAPVHTDYIVRPGQTVSFVLPPEPQTDVVPQDIPLHIAYEDAFAAVLDKPAGIAVHPTLNYPDGTLANGWLYYLQTQGRSGVFRPVNRLDKNTSGLVLCAQNAFAAPALAASAEKTYLAVTAGTLPQVYRGAHRSAGGFHHRAVRYAERQIQPDRVYRPCRNGPLHAGGVPAAHWQDPPDPGAYGVYRASAGGGQPVRRTRAGHRPAGAALRRDALSKPLYPRAGTGTKPAAAGYGGAAGRRGAA